jgi:Cu(I)/Ag(I) efflux system membrane protein CusA/SilA
MIDRIIEWSLNNRFLILLFTGFLVVGGVYVVTNTPLDALPDLSDVQVIVYTKFPGQAPQIVEEQVTYPLTTTMLSVPKTKVVRGYSFFGYSFVFVIFEDGTDMYWARSRVLEYLNFALDKLPDGVIPTLGPDATAVGWVYEYSVESENHDLSQLRSLQDWYIRYQLTTVPGVSEVASVGGFVRQYQVEVDPNKLLAYDLSMKHIAMAIKNSNNDVGGRTLERTDIEYLIRGLGYIKSVDDIANIAVGTDARGTPILIRDVADVHLGPEMRRGVAEKNGRGQVVGGIVIMRFGENALEVIKNVKKKIAEIQKSLPVGVKIVPAYDRSQLIERGVNSLKHKLLEESFFVAVICILFLLHFRSALVAILMLPIGILIAFIVMHFIGVSANIMSLGGIAIAIGAMIPGAVVMIENAHRHIEADPERRSSLAMISRASKEVGHALFHSLLIITLSFLPIFALEAQEGRLFRPLAYTKTFAMAGAALLQVTLVPVLMYYLVRGKIKPESTNPLNKAVNAVYHRLITLVLRHKRTVLIVSLVALIATIFPYSQIGSEFMPPLNEGTILSMPTVFPGVSITEITDILQKQDRILKTFPEVEWVFGKAGRANTATDNAPLGMIETIIQLKPKEDWRPGMTIEKLITEMDKATQLPGVTNTWSMPIKARLDMLTTGIRTPVGVKIFGPDLNVIQEIGKDVERVLTNVPGTASVYAERAVGGYYVDFTIKRPEIARYGLTIKDVEDVLQSAIGGMTVTHTVEGLERYTVNLRYSRELRDNIDKLRRVLVSTPQGEHIPLEQLADIEVTRGAQVVKSENALPNALVFIDIRDRDIGSYVADAKQVVEQNVKLPPGYFLQWSGQYEYMQRAQARLRVVVPITLLIILLLLYFTFKKPTPTLIAFLTIPFGLIGGIWLMYLLNYDMSIAVGVGFIALGGVTAEIGVLMLLYLELAYSKRADTTGINTSDDIHAAVYEGAAQRARPIVMTVAAIIGGLLPIMWGSGTGASVMKRIAAPMVGGMVTATLLALLVIPVLYAVVRGLQLKRSQPTAAPKP